MMNYRLSFLAITFLIAGLAAPPVHAAPGSCLAEGPPGSPSERPKLNAPSVANTIEDRIIGMYVRNLDGEIVGQVSDLFPAPEDPGRLAIAVISQGGFPGMGGRLVAVPFSALTWNEHERGFDLHTTKNRLEAGPSFDRDHGSHPSNRLWSEEFHRYYGQAPYWLDEK